MRRLAILVLILASARSAGADSRSAAIQMLSFPGGPTVVLAPDSLAGAVNVGIWYAAGARNDPAGHAGLAFVMTRGVFSPNAASRAALEGAGAAFHLSVTPDLSSVSVTLPAEQLRPGLEAMAGRVATPVLDAQALGAAIEGARAERRQREQQSPLLPGFERVSATLFAGHGYAAPASGDDAGLASITEAVASQDLASRFAPARALITVTGRFDPADARSVLEKRFGVASRGEPLKTPVIPKFSPIEPRVDGGAMALPVAVVLAGWRLPPGSDADATALEVLARMLVGGVSTRLDRSLVTAEGPIVQIQGSFERRADACMFVVAGALSGAIDTTAIEARLTGEVERYARAPVRESDFQPAQRAIESALLQRIQTSEGRGEALATALLLEGSLDAFEQRLGRLRALTPAALQRAAASALTADRRTVVWTEPAAATEEGQP